MCDDYGTTTYVELCTFSVMYRSTKIDSNWLKRPVFIEKGILFAEVTKRKYTRM